VKGSSAWVITHVVLCLVLLVGCSRPNANTPPPSVTQTVPPLSRGTIRTRFKSVPRQQRLPSSPVSLLTAQPAPSIDDKVIQVIPGDALEANLDIESTFSIDRTVSLMMLLNYQQNSYSVDNGALNDVTDITLRPNAVVSHSLRTQPLAAGYYDLVLVLVLDTQRDPRTFDTMLTPVERRSVYVGAASPPMITYQPFSRSETTDRYTGTVFLTDTPDSFTIWSGTQTTPGQHVSPYLRVSPRKGNLDTIRHPDGTVPMALVAFLDNHVVPIGADSVAYVLAHEGEIQTMPIPVDLPQTPGPHRLFVHLFPNPYVEPVTVTSGQTTFVSDSSQRVTFDVSAP